MDKQLMLTQEMNKEKGIKVKRVFMKDEKTGPLLYTNFR